MNDDKEYLLIKVGNRQYFVKTETGEILAKSENGTIEPSCILQALNQSFNVITI